MRQLTIIVCLFPLLVGCAALRPRPEPPREVTYERPDDDREVTREEAEGVFDPSGLGRYDVGVIRSGGFDTDTPLELTAYARATIFASMLEAFELAGAMTSEQRRDLYDALFEEMPTGPDGTFRAVVIGEFFRSGEPLYILIGIAESPRDGANTDEAVHTLLYQSSALAGMNGVATHAEGRFVDMAVNISWIYPVDATGSVRNVEATVVPVTTARSTAMSRAAVDGPYAREAGGSNPEQRIPEEDEAGEMLLERFDVRRHDFRPLPQVSRERVRLAYRILDRLSPAFNISIVPRLVLPVFSDESEEPWLRVEAGFASFLYELYRNNLEAAEGRLAALSELAEHREQIGERLYNRVTTVAPILLEAIEYEVEHESES